MDFSQFTDSSQHFDSLEPINTHGATCVTYRVKLYGKLHFLKQLKPEFTNDIRYQEAFRKEFETGYRLEHPNLVRYLSFDENSILMEYVDGVTLSQRLASHPEYFKSQKNTEKFVHQLLDVLDYLHSHQVLHLDLKPDNILLTHINDDVKLIDLGFCYTDTFPDTTGKTNTYAAPEQIPSFGKEGQEGFTNIDVRTDIYAFGKILEQLPNHHKYNKVIARCTMENPSARYQTVGELQRALRPLSHLIGLAIAVILAIALALGLYFMLANHDNRSLDSEESPKPVPVIHDSLNHPGIKPIPLPPSTTNQEVRKPVSSVKSEVNEGIPLSQPSKPENTFDIKQLQTDIKAVVLPKYNTTLGALPDSVLPGSKQWAQAGWAFENELTNTLKELILSHQDIPMETVAQEFATYVQSLITLKFQQNSQTP